MIRRSIALLLLVGTAAATSSLAQDKIELLRLPASAIDWGEDSEATVRRFLVGDRTQPEMYAYRVRFPEGTRIEPHFHPENRIFTVIEGTLHIRYGETFDEAAMLALEAGSLWTEPARQPHYVWARNGPVVIQIIGYGPTATTQVGE